MMVLVPILAVAKEVPASTNPTAAPTVTPAAPAAAPTATTTATASATGALAILDAKEREGGWSLFVDLDHALGTGTFVNPQIYGFFGATLSVVPRYVFSIGGIRLASSLALRGAWEYTLPDEVNGRRFSSGDTRLGLSAPVIYKNGLTGITFSPSVGFLIPTSPESWQAGLITNISVGVAFARPTGRFNFGLTANGSRGFHVTGASQTPSRTGAADQINAFQARRSAAGKDEAAVGFSAWNTAWAFNVGGTISFQTTDELSFIVGYTYSRANHYRGQPIGNDETVSKYADDNAHDGERTSTVIAANYQLTDHYGISLSLSTLQTPRSGGGGEQGKFRNPFWATSNAAENPTNISFTFSAAY